MNLLQQDFVRVEGDSLTLYLSAISSKKQEFEQNLQMIKASIKSLDSEYLMFDKVMYKTQNQHRMMIHFHKLKEVQKRTKMFRKMQLTEFIESLEKYLDVAKQDAKIVSITSQDYQKKR